MARSELNTTVLNILIVVALILIEGLFVAAEIALVSLREGQSRALAEQGRRGQVVAKLSADPNRFLAAVQIGVTSTALLSSAVGAVTLSKQAEDALISHGMGKTLASIFGVVGVTLLIAFITLILGELVPKRLSLQRPERAALLFAPSLDRMASALRPVIWLLSRCTDGVVRILGGDPNAGRDSITEDELRGLVAAHESLSSDERRLIDDVFAASERSVSAVMISRTEVVFLEATMSVGQAILLASEAPHSRYPVVGTGHDDVLGFVHIRDLILGAPGVDVSEDRTRLVRELVREIKVLPGSKNVLIALSEMRREGHHVAIVVDEYGGTDGIVTLEDLIEEVIGDIRDEYDDEIAGTRRLTDGVVELDGRSNLDAFAEVSGVELPEGPYETAGGFVMARLGRLPLAGDQVEVADHVLRVVEVDGRRVARLRVEPRAEPPAEPLADPLAEGSAVPAGAPAGSTATAVDMVAGTAVGMVAETGGRMQRSTS